MLPEKTKSTALTVKRASKVALYGILGAIALITTIQVVQFVLGALPVFALCALIGAGAWIWVSSRT